jgi:hypothetical protein
MSDDGKVIRGVVFGPPGYFERDASGNALGLDAAETEEIIALAKEYTDRGGNPHHNPRYRELWGKYDAAQMAALAAEIAKRLTDEQK